MSPSRNIVPLSDADLTDPSRGARDLRTTHWSVVLAAADQQGPGAPEALEQLCRTYWYPLYAFLRRSGHGPEDAQDLTQGFFAHLLSRETRLQGVHPARGKFRSFLLACLTNYLHNERDKADREKRGGGSPHLSIDAAMAEEQYRLLPVEETDPAKIAMRAWANTLIQHVMQTLREQCARDGKGGQFERLKEFLAGEIERGDYARVAESLQMNEGAVRVAVHRLRAEYRQLLLREIARHVADPAEVEAEVRDLFAAFGR